MPRGKPSLRHYVCEKEARKGEALVTEAQVPQVKYAADEGEVYRIVSGCLSVGCTRKQKTKLVGNDEDKDSVAETAIII